MFAEGHLGPGGLHEAQSVRPLFILFVLVSSFLICAHVLKRNGSGRRLKSGCNFRRVHFFYMPFAYRKGGGKNLSVADALADGIERYGVSVLGIVGRLTAFRSNVCGARSVSGSFQEMHMGKYSVDSSGADCKSVAFGFGWCNSIFPHYPARGCNGLNPYR